MNSLTPNLMVNDVNKTIEYYENVLGFEVVMTVPRSGKYSWAMMKRGNAEIMFQERNNLVMEYQVLSDITPGGAFTLFFRVKDVKGLYNDIKEKENILIDLHKTLYRTNEFAIVDLNGYVLTFSG